MCSLLPDILAKFFLVFAAMNGYSFNCRIKRGIEYLTWLLNYTRMRP